MKRAAALCCTTLALGCVPPGGVDEIEQGIVFNQPYNSIYVTSPKDTLLIGYHPTFNVPSQTTCVAADKDAKPTLQTVGENFMLKYIEEKQDLREFFNFAAQAKVDLLLVHAKASYNMREAVNRDNTAIYLGVRAYQYYRVSYDPKSLKLKDDVVTRLQNANGLPIEQVAKEQLLQCGSGYIESENLGGELDASIQLYGDNYNKTVETKKALKLAIANVTAGEWYDDAKTQAVLSSVNIKVHMFARGFKLNGAVVSDNTAKLYVEGQIAKARAAGQNVFRAAVDALKEIHAQLKTSVTADQKSDQSCASAMTFQIALGDYFTLDNAPTKCAGKPILGLQTAINDLGDKLGKFFIAYDSAEKAADRAYMEIQGFRDFHYYWAGPAKQMHFSLLSRFRMGLDHFLDYEGLAAWLDPYVGLWKTKVPEFDLGNKKGVRAVAAAVQKNCSDGLHDPKQTTAIIDACTQNAIKMAEYMMLALQPGPCLTDPVNRNRDYGWGDTGLRNIWTYWMSDRIRPIYVLYEKGDVKGVDVRLGNLSCPAGSRLPKPSEAWQMALASRHGFVPMGSFWLDPTLSPRLDGKPCPADETGMGQTSLDWNQVGRPPPRPGPRDHDGLVYPLCMDAKAGSDVKAAFVCIPPEGPFGLANDFTL